MAVDLSLFSKYRTELMGIAAIMIIACHAPASGVIMPKWLALILTQGNIGVDIFLLLSGMSCWYSLSARPAGGGNFLKKRYTRILVPYLIIYIPYNVLCLFLGRYTIPESIASILTLEFWLYHRGAWFVSVLIPLYLACPLLNKLFSYKWKWYVVIALILALVMFTLYDTPDSKTDVLHNIQYTLRRVPSFIVGFAFAEWCKSDKQIGLMWIIGGAILYLVVRLCLHTSDFLFLIVPFVCYLLIECVKMLKTTFAEACMIFMGTISLESYLTNISMNSLLKAIIPSYFDSTLFNGRYLEYIVVIVGGVFFGNVVNAASKRIL